MNPYDANPQDNTICCSCGDTFPAWALTRERVQAISWSGISRQFKGEDVFCERCRIQLVAPFVSNVVDKP